MREGGGRTDTGRGSANHYPHAGNHYPERRRHYTHASSLLFLRASSRHRALAARRRGEAVRRSFLLSFCCYCCCCCGGRCHRPAALRPSPAGAMAAPGPARSAPPAPGPADRAGQPRRGGHGLPAGRPTAPTCAPALPAFVPAASRRPRPPPAVSRRPAEPPGPPAPYRAAPPSSRGALGTRSAPGPALPATVCAHRAVTGPPAHGPPAALGAGPPSADTERFQVTAEAPRCPWRRRERGREGPCGAVRAGARAGSPRGSDRAPLRCPTAVPAWVPGPADPAESCRRASAAGMSPARRAARNSVGDPVQFIEVLLQTGGVFLPFQPLDGEQPGSGILEGWVVWSGSPQCWTLRAQLLLQGAFSC